MNNKDKLESNHMEDTNHTDNDVDNSSSHIALEDSRRSGNNFGLLMDILVEDGDGDLVVDGEDRVMQWLQALDMQVIGACRVDDRLKLNGSVAEDRLLATPLAQHFEPSEVALLAKCLCIPLVSIRVGKINKQGNLMCPTSTRGSITLTLLPTSNLRISFIDDDGQIERLVTISSGPCSSCIEIEEIPADQSGRSFVLKIAGSKDLYFWSSERSKLLGDELLKKLKTLLMKKPSLADVTGISESRLRCFATHLRSFLGGSTVTKTRTTSVVSVTLPVETLDAEIATLPSNPAHSQNFCSQEEKPDSFYQSHISLIASSIKEVLPRNISTFTSVFESLRPSDESHFSFAENIYAASPDYTDECSLNRLKAKLSNSVENLRSPLSFLDSLEMFCNPPFPSPVESEVSSSSSSLFSPYYCWCPPVATAMQHTPIPTTEPFLLPPLSSLLSTSRPSSLLASEASLVFSEFSSLDFPPFLAEPSVRYPLSLPLAQQIATYTPLMCDPIVHIPVIGICSSGPGYLVSAGPAISTTVPPLHPYLANASIPESSLVIENSARETLQLLLSHSGQNSDLMSVLPTVLTNSVDHRSVLAAGNRGLYDGTSNVGVIASNIAAMGLVPLSEMPLGSILFNGRLDQGNMVNQLEKPIGSFVDDEGNSFSNLDEGSGLID